MKIKWKAVLLAGIWAEALLLVLRIPIINYYGADTPAYMGVILWFAPMFLGGLWVAQKIESRYILHGIWVGIVANAAYFPMALLLSFIIPEPAIDQSAVNTGTFEVFVVIAAIFVKIFGSGLGSCIGGKMSEPAKVLMDS